MSLGFKALFKIDRVITDGFECHRRYMGHDLLVFFFFLCRVRLRGWSSSMQGLTAWA